MKLMHLSDLHLGKRVYEFSMLEDQKYILDEILEVIDREAPDVVMIAGDVYDKAVPSGEAVCLFDAFLCSLAERDLQVMMISGNHDSPERLAFGGRLMERAGVHISPVYQGVVVPVTLEDSYGAVQFFLLPFVKPAHVRRYYEEETVESYTDAVRTVISHMDRDPAARQVLLLHQFVTGALRSESEEISVGGMDQVDGSVLEGFDYVAMGHIHGPQQVGKETIRYCGTPLKYSFSEAGQEKSVTVAELREKGDVTVRKIPLTPRREMRTIRGSYLELTARAYYREQNREDYLQVILTDEEDVPDAMAKLRVIYPNVMRLEYDNTRTRAGGQMDAPDAAEAMSPLEIFGKFYEKQNHLPMSEEQEAMMRGLMESIWEENA